MLIVLNWLLPIRWPKSARRAVGPSNTQVKPGPTL